MVWFLVFLYLYLKTVRENISGIEEKSLERVMEGRELINGQLNDLHKDDIGIDHIYAETLNYLRKESFLNNRLFFFACAQNT